nr:DUF4367 domain-containing protein [uncultured Acetatifactor sp.]
MKKISVTDEWLYKYMPVVDEAIIRELESNIDYEYQFTDKFERRMKKLMRREAYPWIGIFYRLYKKAAILFVCMISSLFVITMSVQAYRVKFYETVKSVWEDSIFYSYFVQQKQEPIQYSELGYIPEGYQETDRFTSEHLFNIIYTNENGEMITWDQMLVQDGGKLIADIEYDQQIMKEINGKIIVISLYYDGFVHAYYERGEYVYVLTADHLDIDEVCLIFDSILVN